MRRMRRGGELVGLDLHDLDLVLCHELEFEKRQSTLGLALPRDAATDDEVRRRVAHAAEPCAEGGQLADEEQVLQAVVLGPDNRPAFFVNERHCCRAEERRGRGGRGGQLMIYLEWRVVVYYSTPSLLSIPDPRPGSLLASVLVAQRPLCRSLPRTSRPI